MSSDPRQGRQAPPWQTILSGAGYYGRGQVPPDQYRVSDAERQQIADTLGKHFADGRLDQSEFDERVSRAMAAKTRGDLRGLLDDLPPAGPIGPIGGPAPAPPQRPRTHKLLFLAAVVFLVAATSAALTAPWHFPWVLFLVLGFLLLRGRRRWHGWHHHYHGPQGYRGGPYGPDTY